VAGNFSRFHLTISSSFLAPFSPSKVLETGVHTPLTPGADESTRTLQKLLDAYVAHLKGQGRRSHADVDPIFKRHVAEA
jgi:hypothetical protein